MATRMGLIFGCAALASCGGGGRVSTLEGSLSLELSDGRSFQYDGKWSMDPEEDEPVNGNTGLVQFTDGSPMSTRSFLPDDSSPFDRLEVEFTFGSDPFVYPGPAGELYVTVDNDFQASAPVPMLTDEIIYSGREFQAGLDIQGETTLNNGVVTIEATYAFDLVTGSDCDKDGKRLTTPNEICDFAGPREDPYVGTLQVTEGLSPCPVSLLTASGIEQGGQCEYDGDKGKFSIGDKTLDCKKGVAFGYTCHEMQTADAEGCSWDVDLVFLSAPTGRLLAKPDAGCAVEACYDSFTCAP
jgi:hypothetical protein